MAKKNNNATGLTISADRIQKVPGYEASPKDGKPYILYVPDLTIFAPQEPNKAKTATRALYTVARVNETVENRDFCNKYGHRFILVSDKFTKMSAKMQLRFVEMTCFELGQIPDKFVSGLPGFKDVAQAARSAAELQVGEKYGFRWLRKLSNKEHTFNLNGEKHAVKWLHRAERKNKKSTAKNTSNEATPAVALDEPLNLASVKPAELEKPPKHLPTPAQA